MFKQTLVIFFMKKCLADMKLLALFEYTMRMAMLYITRLGGGLVRINSWYRGIGVIKITSRYKKQYLPTYNLMRQRTVLNFLDLFGKYLSQNDEVGLTFSDFYVQQFNTQQLFRSGLVRPFIGLKIHKLKNTQRWSLVLSDCFKFTTDEQVKLYF